MMDEMNCCFLFLQAIFSSPDNVVSEAYATNPVLNQVSESYYGALNHQVNQSPNLLTSDLNSQSKAPASSLIRTPMDGNMPTDVPARQNSLGLWKYLDADIACLGDNTSPVLTSRPVIDEIPFHIIEISSEWAYCTEDTKVSFYSPHPTPPPPSSAVQFSWKMLYFTFIFYGPLKPLFILTIYQHHLSPGWVEQGWAWGCAAIYMHAY